MECQLGLTQTSDVASKLVEIFKCCVCLGYVRPGQKLRCCTTNGHLVCDTCYASMKKIKKKSDNSEVTCPVCRVGKFDESASFAALKSVFDLAKKFIFYECQGSAWGCAYKYSASALVEHEAVCPNVPSICPGDGCNFRAPFSHLRAHNLRGSSGEYRGDSRRCFIELTESGNSTTFFVWKVDFGGRKLLTGETRHFTDPGYGFEKPVMLCSQDPNVKVCLVTGFTEDKEFFTASVVQLQDSCLQNAKGKKGYVHIIAKSCCCNSQTFVRELSYQNWDKSEMEADGRQLKMHRSTLSDIVKDCPVCCKKNPVLTLQIELVFGFKK